MREYKNRWAKARRAEVMAGKSCVQCGSTERLEVDHIDPAQKESHRIWTWSRERRDAELAKCQILCHECHKIKTAAQRKIPEHGTVSRYTSKKHKCRCEPCRAANRARAAEDRARLKSGEKGRADLAALAERLDQAA